MACDSNCMCTKTELGMCRKPLEPRDLIGTEHMFAVGAAYASSFLHARPCPNEKPSCGVTRMSCVTQQRDGQHTVEAHSVDTEKEEVRSNIR